MPDLSDLSDDVRYEIAKLLVTPRESLYSGKKNFSPLISLSSTCRSLNATCGFFIFRRYHLDLRTSKGLWTRNAISYPPGSSRSRWDIGAINLRLAHLRSKASFVRELLITDEGQMGRHDVSEMPEPEAFPGEFMPELLATLHVLRDRNITAIHLVTSPKTLINVDLWKWVVDMRSITLSLEGQFKTPVSHDLALIEHLEALSLDRCVLKTINLFDFKNITELCLTYGRGDERFTFRPESQRLRHINIVIDMLYRDFTHPFFDFSKVPHASITVRATFNVEYKFHIPSAWSSNKPNLQRMFSENLTGYDVCRTSSCTVIIKRRGGARWVPVNQVHLEGPEEEAKEQQEMSEYYALKAQLNRDSIRY